MKSQLFNKLLQDSGHLVSVEALTCKEPVTTTALYSGEHEGRQYYFRAGVNNGLAWTEEFAKSSGLRRAYEEYIHLYYENSWMKKQRWDVTNYETFWDEQTLESCQTLINEGVIPSEEEFVASRLGLCSGCNQ